MLPPEKAIGLIRRCKESGLRVLGIDGFRLTENTTQPLMEHSIDYSIAEPFGVERDDVIANCHAAEEFIKAKLDLGLYFEITIQ